MNDGPPVILLTGDGRRISLPILPETLVRRRMDDAAGERLEFVAHLDDRLGDTPTTSARTLETLATLSDDVEELRWGSRRFPVRLVGSTVTETAFQEKGEPIAATITFGFEVIPAEGATVSVTVAGERWRSVPDLGSAGPNDPVYELRLDEAGSLSIRFGDGKHGARPPAGDVVVQARYRLGTGKAGQ